MRGRKLLAGSLLGLALATAAPAQADPMDTYFIDALNGNQIGYASRDKAIEAGHQACLLADAAEAEFPTAAGSDIFAALASYVVGETNLPQEGAEAFVGASISAYCRDNLYMLKGISA